jgi:hypothetical protein
LNRGDEIHNCDEIRSAPQPRQMKVTKPSLSLWRGTASQAGPVRRTGRRLNKYFCGRTACSAKEPQPG